MIDKLLLEFKGTLNNAGVRLSFALLEILKNEELFLRNLGAFLVVKKLKIGRILHENINNPVYFFLLTV